MSNDLSPDQQDPEKRIAELERGLADANYRAAREPSPVREYGASPAAGSPAAWMPTPAQSGYQGTPFFNPLPARRTGSRLWLWMLILVGVVLPLAGTLAFAIPWHSLNVFGPTQVPKGGSLTVNDSNATETVDCNDGNLTVNGTHLTVTVTGHCVSLNVNGTYHHVTVDSADTIDANGIDNVIIYHSGEPKISTNGINVTIQQG